MTDFIGNTRKTHLKRRINRAWQQLKSLKKIEGWSALLKPDRLRRPRARRAGVTMFDVALWTLVLIPVLIGVLSLYQGAVDTTRAAALRSQLTRAVAIIERDHTYSGVYKGDSSNDGSLLIFLKNEGFTNKELGGNPLIFTSPYGTEITIEPDDNNNRRFVVTLSSKVDTGLLPLSGCETAGMTFANQNSGLKSLEIGGERIPASNSAGTGITELAVSTACDDDENSVVLTF